MRLFFSIILSLFLVFVNAQTIQWARQGGGSGNDLGQKISVDVSGNCYVTGYFQNTVTFGPYSLTNTPTTTNTFLAKYDAAGNILWLHQVAGNQNAPASVVYCPAQNCIYVAGKFVGTITLGSYTLTTFGNNDCYFAQYDPNGNCIWAIQAGSLSGDRVDDIDCDLTGNLIATGMVWSGGVFGNYTVPSHYLYQTFTTSISPSGNFLWTTISCYNFSGSSVAVPYPTLKTDMNSNIYVSGLYSSTCVFGSQTLTVPGTSGLINIFLQKLSPAGIILWTIVMDGNSNNESTEITTDDGSNIYVTGNFLGTTDFGGVTKTVTAPLTKYDIFLAKYDPNGNLLWAQQYGNTDNDYGKSVSVLPNHSILIAGYYANSTHIGSFNFTGAGSSDGFMALLDSNGTPTWANTYGSASSELIMSAVPYNNSEIYFTGYFNGSATYGSYTLSSAGAFDVGVFKIGLPVPLPVELVVFTVEAAGKNHALCKWATASETGNNYFALEKSVDGNSFQPVTQIQGAGNSACLREYCFTDVNPYLGISYYRLSQTDYNGKSQFLKTVPFRLTKNNISPVQCYPTIGNGDFTIHSDKSITEIKVTDIDGSILKDYFFSGINATFVLQLNELVKGMYFLQFNPKEENNIVKVIIE